VPPATRSARRRTTAPLGLSRLGLSRLGLSTLSAVALTAATLTAAVPAQAATPRSAGPLTAITHTVSASAQQATRGLWTRQATESATPLPRPEPVKATATAAAVNPNVIPHPTAFNGVPTVGALFLTIGKQRHFCTASVVNSLTANLVLTAAHCVYGSGPVTNAAFVPGYSYGHEPYGAWPVETVTVAAGWQQSHDPDLDFAFLKVAPPAGTHVPIQFVTGGLWLGINQGYVHPIYVIGYNNPEDYPLGCATHSFRYKPVADTMQFKCRAFWNGTSGGPWITNYNSGTGTGTVIGVIGGYEEGGLVAWSSYSTYFGLPTLQLFVQAEKAQA
jgi:V8-like Glu-specific endopeptidase